MVLAIFKIIEAARPSDFAVLAAIGQYFFRIEHDGALDLFVLGGLSGLGTLADGGNFYDLLSPSRQGLKFQAQLLIFGFHFAMLPLEAAKLRLV